MQLRPLAQTGIQVSPVAMGCWPISGMTSLGVTEQDSLEAIATALDCGVNSFDTAYCYGRAGESEKLIARALAGRRDRAVIATKSGMHWGADGRMVKDARPETLRRECEESLRRLQTDRVELLYLHAPDPTIPIAESAAGLLALQQEGKTRSVGVSNVTVAQLEEFAAVCPIAAYQPHYNMLQREIERDTLPWCQARGIAVMVYWPLLKGLLAGKLARDHVFDPRDGRAKYPMFQGDEWQKNQDLVDELRAIAADAGRTVAQVVVNWTIHRPGITSALCGAKRPEQIRETAAAMGWQLSDQQQAQIEQALARRGTPQSQSAV